MKPAESKMKPLEGLCPVLQKLCGICTVPENDLNGEVAHPKHDNTISPALAKKIEKARQDYAEGRYTECKTPEELTAFLEARDEG